LRSTLGRGERNFAVDYECNNKGFARLKAFCPDYSHSVVVVKETIDEGTPYLVVVLGVVRSQVELDGRYVILDFDGCVFHIYRVWLPMV
jgi:hypothetical protein